MSLSEKMASRGALALWVLAILLLAVGSIFEPQSFFATLWFRAIWCAIALLLLFAVVATRMWCRVWSFILHTAILIILAGGAITAIWGERGTLTLYPDHSRAVAWITAEDGRPRRLPQPMALDSFVVVSHRASAVPADYISHISLASGRKATIAVNRPLVIGSYRFCQASYDGAGASVISVSHDPARGTEITYVGCILFLLGFLLVMIDPHGNYRRWLRELRVEPGVQKCPRIVPVVIIATVLTVQLIHAASVWASRNSIPLANGSEAMAFTSILLTGGALWLCVARRWMLTLLAFTMGCFAALVAWLASPPADSLSSPVVPVLASPWLAIHVGIIMSAYALLAMTFALSVVGALRPSRQLRRATLALLYPALFLLAAGIFAGSVWAAQAWGRHWAWDPKETWALITLMVYSIALHKRMGPRALALFIICAFLTVVFTYWGVNYLPSLHAYR